MRRKKLLAMLLAATMVAGMAVTTTTSVYALEPTNQGDTDADEGEDESATSAATTYSITLKSDTDSVVTGHTYKVYQLFVGDLSNGKLSNVKYGSAGLGDEGTAVPDSVLENIVDADDTEKTSAEKAEAYAQSLTISNLTSCGSLTADKYTLTGLAAGYYLIVDDTSAELAEGDTYSKYIVQVVENVEMSPKSETVTSDKKEYDDSAALATVNDAGIGTVVSYQLTGKVAADASAYDYYYFIMADTLSDGLTFNKDSVVVTATGSTTPTYQLYVEDSTTATEEADGYTFEVAFTNAKDLAGQTITVTYSATLNSNAIAMDPEENTYHVIYSNNPYEDYSAKNNPDTPGKPTVTPGSPLEGEGSVFGTTPAKETETYTTKLVLTKVGDNNTPLEGATFKLTSANANQTVVNTNEYFVVNNDVAEKDAWYLLKDGTYVQTAPTDASYVKVGTGDSKTTEGYILKDGEYVVPTDTKDYADQDLYMLVLGTESKYASTNKYEKKTATSTASTSAPVEVILTTDSTGVLTFDQLGTGTYILSEVDAPDGYNYLASDVTFTIEFVPGSAATEDTAAVAPTFKVTNVSGAEITNNNGTFTTTVQDNSGTVLPSTGGIGTTIFYVAGMILVLGAGIILVAKRRIAR